MPEDVERTQKLLPSRDETPLKSALEPCASQATPATA